MNQNKSTNIKNVLESRTDKTTNKEGGLAFTGSDKLILYSQVASWLVSEPKFYHDVVDEDGTKERNQDSAILDLARKVAKSDPEFVLQLAKYARTKLYLRTAPSVLLVEAALIAESKKFVRAYAPSIVGRADELCTVVAYLKSRIGDLGNKAAKGSMPAALKRGLADSFNNFNEYQFGKYDNKRKQVKLVDVLRLVHPNPADEEKSALFKKIKDDTLATPKTWETIISDKGSNTESWTEASKVMPYMALLRNLRNLITHKVDLTQVLEKLQDPDRVAKSRQFPYRFYSARKAVAEGTESFDSAKVLDAIEKALELSTDNVPKLKGNTFLAADNSGSMANLLSERATVQYRDVANLMMAIAGRICDQAMCSVFANDFATVSMPNSNGILANMEAAKRVSVGYATNAYLVIDSMIKHNINADRIILFSDMQCYDTSGYSNSLVAQLMEYRRKINPNCYFYSVDLAGYGTLQIPENDSKTCLIAGWSDKILQYIPVFESDGKTVLDEIQQITP